LKLAVLLDQGQDHYEERYVFLRKLAVKGEFETITETAHDLPVSAWPEFTIPARFGFEFH
jgi:hypothetical protein